MPRLADPKAPLVFANAKPREKAYLVNDGRGLALLVIPDGAKRWLFRYSYGGRQKKIGIKGGYPAVPIKTAREEADRFRAMLAVGQDPIQVRKEGQEDTARKLEAERVVAARKSDTFEKVAREWHSKEAETLAEITSVATMQRLVKDLFPYIGTRAIADFTPPDILVPLRKVEGRGAKESARRLLGYCSQIFRYAVQTGRIQSDPSRDLRGALSRPKERHFAALTKPEDVCGLVRAFESYNGTPETRIALEFGLLTFVRPGNLRQAEWSEFYDLDKPDRAEWRIPGKKLKVRTQRDFVVPLAPRSLELLDELRPLTGSSKYLFPSARSKLRPMSSNTVLAALRRMGYSTEEMTGHGVRATARTICDEILGFSPEVIEEQLAHSKPGSLRDAYDRTTHMPQRRRLMSEWARFLAHLRAHGWDPETYDPKAA